MVKPHSDLCTYQCIAPPTPLGIGGALHTKMFSHYGAFDNRMFIKHPSFFCYNFYSMSYTVLQLGTTVGGFGMLGLPYYGAFDIQLCQIPL